LRDVRETREAIREALGEQMRGAALAMVGDLFRQEAEALCGRPHQRKHEALFRRGGSEEGSVYLAGQRMRVRRPRVRDRLGEARLESYAALQEYDVLCQEVTRLLVRGVSTRHYEGAIQEISGGLGLKRSSVSRAFQAASRKDLDEVNGRDLSKDAWAACFFDGLEVEGIHVIVGLGVTEDGRKILLGLREGSSENAEVVKDLLVGLRDRGFSPGERILVVLDGAKALRKAVVECFGPKVLIQRCQVHKVRNVLSYLPESYHAEARRRLLAAWGLRTYEEAKRELGKVRDWLSGISEGAARSLEEGMEETLTVLRLGLPEGLRRHFASTNLIESVLASARLRMNRVTRWRGSDHVMRWVASGLRFHEGSFRRLFGHRQMPLLIAALEKAVGNRQEKVA
jgi:transposase-like protein